jgi:hypothetical protein
MKLNFTRAVILLTALLVFNIFDNVAGHTSSPKLYAVNAGYTTYNSQQRRYGFVQPTYMASLTTYKLTNAACAAPLNENMSPGVWTKIFSMAAITQLFYAVVIIR